MLPGIYSMATVTVKRHQETCQAGVDCRQRTEVEKDGATNQRAGEEGGTSVTQQKARRAQTTRTRMAVL